MVTITPATIRALPERPAPELFFDTIGGGRWQLAESRPQTFTLVAFYRGLHCCVCKAQISELAARVEEFDRRGVSPVAVSCDNAERAAAAVKDWRLGALTLGYALPRRMAQDWGLFLSEGRGTTSSGIGEPALFCEPGLFLLRPDGSVYCAWVQSVPFARPHMDDVLAAIDFILAKDYPARGAVSHAAPVVPLNSYSSTTA